MRRISTLEGVGIRRLGSGLRYRKAGPMRAVVEPLESRVLLSESVWAFPAADGHLIYHTTPLGDRIPDFSNVGYKGGLAPIPDVPVKVTVGPVAGDDTASIQNAINAVKAMPLDENGFRGTVLLLPGEYQVGTNLRIDASGIVLRGSGIGHTFIRATGTGQRTIIQVAGGTGRSEVSGTRRNIIDKYVPTGAYSFRVDNPAGYAVGDNIIVFRPSPQNWLDDLGMNLLDNPWTPGSRNMVLERVITHIDGNYITLDGPINQAIDQKYGGGQIYKYTATGRISNVGVEHLSGISDFNRSVTTGSGSSQYYSDNDHPWRFISISGVINGWVRNTQSKYFGNGNVSVVGNSKWITVQNSETLDPVSVITGGNRYSFNLDNASHVLFTNLHTRLGRHDYVTGSLTYGPNVFADSRADQARSDTGPHHRYATVALWDNLEINGHQINIQNRHNSGTGHGWAGANEVVWNSRASRFTIQNPPTAYNWAIGNVGPTAAGNPGLGTQGIYDSHGTPVDTRSLYYAQLAERQQYESYTQRELRLGDIDSYFDDGASDAAPVDPAWMASINSLGMPVGRFDQVINGRVIPFTFNYNIPAGTYIVGASLTLGLKSAGGSSANDRIYFEHLSRSYTWDELGVTPPGTVDGARVIDLTDLLPALQDGRLNVAIAGNTAIDWATLTFQTASVFQPDQITLTPVADAYVRDGSFANTNFGSDPTLAAKLSTSSFNRESYLRFDLSSITGIVTGAYVRLVPVSVGVHTTADFESTTGGIGAIFNRISFVPNDGWTENGITWNNRPGSTTIIDEYISRPNAPLMFNVTPLVLSELAGNQNLSLRIVSLTDSSADPIVYASREHANIEFRPQLVVMTYDGVTPVADAYVRGGTSANQNFGTAPDLAIKNDTSTSLNNEREAFLRFDLSGFATAPANAAVRLMPLATPSVVQHSAAFVSNNAWLETGITWNNKPASSAVLGSWVPTAGTWSQVNVTQAAAAAFGSSKLLSLHVYSNTPSSAAPVQYASREHADVAIRPALVSTNLAPIITPIVNVVGDMDTSTPPIWFAVWDAETPLGSLTVTATSSNQALLPDGNITLSGSGTDRTFVLAPVPGQHGSATVTITVTDAQGLSASTQFDFSVSNAMVINGDQQFIGQNDIFRIVRDGSFFSIFRNDMVNPVLHMLLAGAPPVTVNGRGGNDLIIIDYSAGDPIPAAGLTVDGGDGLDIVRVIGTSGNDAVMLSSNAGATGHVVVNSSNPVSYLNAQRLHLVMDGGMNTLSVGGDSAVTAAEMLLDISGGALVSMAIGSSLPSFTDLQVGGGSTFSLNGQNQTINGLSGSGTIINNGAAAATLTVGAHGGGGGFGGSLTNGSAVLGLTKVGPGTLTLSGTNSYTGLSTLSGGVLASGNAGSFAGLSGQVRFNGGTFRVTADTVAANVANKFTTSFTGATTSSTGTFEIDDGVTLTIGGASASLQTAGGGARGGPFTKTGLGTLRILGGNNQQDDPLLLAAGTIVVEHADALGRGDPGVRLDMKSGTTLVLRQNVNTNFQTPIHAVDPGGTINVVIDRQTMGSGVTHLLNELTSGGPFTLNVTAGGNIAAGQAMLGLGSAVLGGGGTFEIVNTDTATAVASVSGTVTGEFGVTKNGSGRLIFAGANTYTGTTTVNTGALRVAHPSGLGATSAGTTIAGGTATGRVELVGGITVAEPFALGNRTASGGGNFAPHIVNVSGTNTLTGNIALNTGGSYWTIQSDAGKLTVAGNLTNNNTSNTRVMFLRGAGEGEVAGEIRQTNVSQTQVVKQDGGTWTLNGPNNYTGGTVVNAGTLAVTASAIPANDSVTVNGGVYRMTGAAAVFILNSLSINDGGTAIVTADGGNRLVVDELSITDEGRLDLMDNLMTVQGGDLAALDELIASGRAGGSWNGFGITSSIAATQPGRALGMRPNGGDVEVAFTWAGDANLDGVVSIADLGILAANWQQGGKFWHQGNFNYDNLVNIADLGILAANWQKGVEEPEGGFAAAWAEVLAK